MKNPKRRYYLIKFLAEEYEALQLHAGRTKTTMAAELRGFVHTLPTWKKQKLVERKKG